ncbi:bifunctional diguanylate cyclase/phosphodiesterase [Rhodobacter sp. SY28-1]|uniref:bifunctional diguanylate cyclase/phosphodiesterase n=1 Tax=Rhodobacter sp. SY28-1 TaxID=2562317 RepID=UPI0010C02A88|nr:bifunctional diguanylate cyclase/phosphodiesterase [Rhodobacter sp. SY28-1]
MTLALQRLARHAWQILALVPLFALSTYWIAGELALVALAAALPVVVLAFGRPRAVDETGATSDRVIARLDDMLTEAGARGGATGCLVIQFEDAAHLCDRLGRVRQSEVLSACVARLRGALRPRDLLYTLEDGSLAVVLATSPRLDLEIMVRIAARLQLVVQQPVTLSSGPVQVTCSVGFCSSMQLARPSGLALLDAAQVAGDEAASCRPGAIRGYSADLARARADRDALRAGFSAAVQRGEVRAWFQPQVSTDSGEVTGVEALVRWLHPERGCLAPGTFLPAIDGSDLMELLGQTMLTQSMAALAEFDRKGLRIPTVAVNFSQQELRDPHLPERLGWTLDHFGLDPSRLTVEVLESVVAGDGDDVLAANIGRIAAMGCGVDLDDFGAGHASITAIRRFALNRLKIDRSFVQNVDQNRDQQNLITAILSLAERLGLETLAEGVETPGEHALLAQLGCGHVQGYVIAKPMPVEELAGWLAAHREKRAQALRIGVRAR